MPIIIDGEEESVSWNISAFALPSNLNLLYGQTLIYVLQSFGNSGKLLFSSDKNISGVFIDDIDKNFHNKPENQDEDALGKIEQQQDLSLWNCSKHK